jgi:hypothetical protein
MEFGIYGFGRHLVRQGKHVHVAKALSGMGRGFGGHALKEDKS